MKARVISRGQDAGGMVVRMGLFLATLAIMGGVAFLFASFIDLVQTWALAPQWSLTLLD